MSRPALGIEPSVFIAFTGSAHLPSFMLDVGCLVNILDEISVLAQQLRLDTSLVYQEIYWALGEERINRLTPTKEQFSEWKRSADGLMKFWSFAEDAGLELWNASRKPFLSVIATPTVLGHSQPGFLRISSSILTGQTSARGLAQCCQCGGLCRVACQPRRSPEPFDCTESRHMPNVPAPFVCASNPLDV